VCTLTNSPVPRMVSSCSCRLDVPLNSTTLLTRIAF
jgi:hypothetical protein